MSKSASMPIDSEVQKQLKIHFSGVQEYSMVIGVSGGADSMCLLHVLHQQGIKLYIVHVNYQKRGTASDKDAQLVADTAADLGIDYEVVTVDPDEAGTQNFQQWARDVRYGALEIKADNVGADAIAVGHHQNDQVETILQKIFRGGGMASWQAMQVWDGRLFRPLLNIRREDIEAYCREHTVPYREDESNFGSDFARNFLRNDWLPELEQHFPGWQKNVLRVAGQASVFKSSLQYILQDITSDRDRLNCSQFLALDLELQKSVLIYYATQINPDQEISRHALKELSKLPQLQTGKSIQLTESMELMRDRDFFKLVVNTGETGSYITLKKKDVADQNISLNGLLIGMESFKDPDFSGTLYLDTDAIAWPLHIRPWQNGDQFQPLGMEGHQSVADHLTNRKISAVEKEKALVVESFEETICAVIFPPIENRRPPGTISEWTKCTQSTRRCLTITRLQ